jgi:hypothetical protein
MADQSESTKPKLTSDEVEGILRRVDRLPILADCTAETIPDYDEHGLPR